MKSRKTIVVTGILAFVIILAYTCLSGVPKYNKKILVAQIDSPNKEVQLSIYQGPMPDSVMVDDYVVGEITVATELLGMKKNRMIYYQYGEIFEEAYWVDNETIVINGKSLHINDPKTWLVN